MSNKILAALAAVTLGTTAFAATSAPAVPALPVQSAEAAVNLPYVTPTLAPLSTTSAGLNEAPNDLVVGSLAASGRTAILKSTAYNSLSSQTDSTPHITATGTRTRPGVVALSRDMLRLFPYGTRVRITPLNGSHPYVNGRVFIVEDTMHARKTGQVDIWMPTRSQAMQWGVRSVRITAL